MERNWLIITLLLAFCTLHASAQVSFDMQGADHVVSSERYEARIAPDGCMTSLKIYGKEFFNAAYNKSRGTYFYQNGPLKLSNLKRAGQSLQASSEKAKISYIFGTGSIIFKVKNLTDKGMSFFLIIDSAVNAVMNEKGEIFRVPVTQGWKRSVWLHGSSRLEIAGSDRLWEWGGSGNNVFDVPLEGRKSRTIELKVGKASGKDLAKLSRLPPRIGEGAEKMVTILSPRSCQVFQRSTKKAGPILISGRVRADNGSVEARITGPSLPGEWFDLKIDPLTRSFNHRMDLAAGGWYQLEVRSKKNGSVAAVAIVDKFGVGEVFVTAGQSNSTNCGQFRTKQASGMVASFNGLAWRPGDDPFWGPHDNSQGGSPWAAFGDALYEKYRVPIGIAVTGHGGTSVNQWQPGRYERPADIDGSALFHWMMVRIHQLGPHGFRAVLWHQGESDCKGETTESYMKKMTRVIRASKQAAGWEFPWFAAQVSYHNPDNPKHENIRKAHARLWKEGIALPGPDTDTLVGKDRDYEGRGIHFSPVGLTKHGRMWAEKVIPWLDIQLR